MKILLNHKEAIDFIAENSDYLFPLSVSKIEDIHSILTKELAVGRNIRKRRVGISGTNYQPLDNEFQIKEALAGMCNLINKKYCPTSFRTVDSVDYKKAMLLFYEQNNITAFKMIFIDQFEFAVKTYF